MLTKIHIRVKFLCTLMLLCINNFCELFLAALDFLNLYCKIIMFLLRSPCPLITAGCHAAEWRYIMTYEMDIAGLKRELPLCKVTDDLYIGAFVMFGDVELTVHCAAELLKRAPEYDYIIAPEAKAIPLLYEMARQSGAEKYFLARKVPKAYMTGVFEVSVKSITTMSVQRLIIDTADAELIKGKRMLIVDDVISTGESLRAMEKLVTAAGGIIVGRMAVLAEGDAADRDDIITLAPLPVFNPDGTIKEK